MEHKESKEFSQFVKILALIHVAMCNPSILFKEKKPIKPNKSLAIYVKISKSMKSKDVKEFIKNKEKLNKYIECFLIRLVDFESAIFKSDGERLTKLIKEANQIAEYFR